MVIAAEQHRRTAERGNALRFGRPPRSSVSPDVRKGYSGIGMVQQSTDSVVSPVPISSAFEPLSGRRRGENRFLFIGRSADSNPGTSGTPGQQINEYFTGSTFGTSGNQTADGTHYNWTILYQRENYDAMPGVYQTGNGAFNPRQQSLLAPDLGVIQQGISAYNPTAGETGFNGRYDRNASTIAGLSETGLGLAGIYLTGGLADLASPFISSALGLSGTAAAGAASAAEETSGMVGALEDWEGANAAARLAARDAAFETDNAMNAVGTAASNQANAVSAANAARSLLILAKAGTGAVTSSVSSFIGSMEQGRSLGQDLGATGFGAISGDQAACWGW
ncbi:MAG: hypothetical protein ACP5QA_15445 [Phycisphaerae bacterium]